MFFVLLYEIDRKVMGRMSMGMRMKMEEDGERGAAYKDHEPPSPEPGAFPP